MKSKSTSTSSIPITSHTCLQAVSTKKTLYGQLTKVRKGEWQTTSRDRFLCHWLKTESESFPHFTLTAYHGELVGADPFIHQDLTLSQCLYDNFSCAPKEKPHSVLVWPKVNHTRRRFQYLGNYTIHRVGDYILIPKLRIGGAVQSTSADGKFIQLDNGYLYQQHHSESSNYARFLAASIKYLRQAKPSLTTDLVEAHITVALEIQRADTIQ